MLPKSSAVVLGGNSRMDNRNDLSVDNACYACVVEEESYQDA